MERKPALCVSCLKRPRVLPYTKCNTCRRPMYRARSMKVWRIRKRMKAARERHGNEEQPR
jgi:hypothetical protein